VRENRMHGLTGGDWKRSRYQRNRASPRPSQIVMCPVSGLAAGGIIGGLSAPSG
jgi:hypothetical protein